MKKTEIGVIVVAVADRMMMSFEMVKTELVHKKTKLAELVAIVVVRMN